MKKYAEMKVSFTVFFEDNGVDDILDQAFDAAEGQLNFPFEDIELIGFVQDAE